MSMEEKSKAILAIYHQVDEATAQFQAKSGLVCQAGCGRCCENPKVEATLLEVLPLAWELWHQGAAEKVYEELSILNAHEPCRFFQSHPQIKGHGRCQVYPYRPLICRVFGFVGIKDKYGVATILTCPTIKSECQEQYERIEQAVRGQEPIPFVADFAMQVHGLDPQLSLKHWPINVAVMRAIEKIGLIVKANPDPAFKNHHEK